MNIVLYHYFKSKKNIVHLLDMCGVITLSDKILTNLKDTCILTEYI